MNSSTCLIDRGVIRRRRCCRRRIAAVWLTGLLALISGACTAAGHKAPMSLLGRPLTASPPGDVEKLEAELALAREELAAHPYDPERIIWVGRRLGYLWRMREAIDVFTDGMRSHPANAALYRHRGHRYISLRRFDKATADLQRAAELSLGMADVVEQDGLPGSAGEPLTTLKFNIYYLLGLAHYLRAEFEQALAAYGEAGHYTRGLDDNKVAVAYWTYMTLGRLGRRVEAQALLAPITITMDVRENVAYYRCLLMFKGLLKPGDLLDAESTEGVGYPTTAYGIGNWFLVHGEVHLAQEYFERAISSPFWPAFGYIASEVELARKR